MLPTRAVLAYGRTNLGALLHDSIETPRGWRMASRVLVNFAAAATLLATTTASFAIGETEEMTTGGRPFGGLFGSLFGTSPTSRETVNYAGTYTPGTIIVNTRERRLYLILNGGQALRYGIGVGRIGFTWSGVKTVSAKKEWPGWTPPSQMLRRRPDLPRYMPGGIDNPLGARAIYLGSSLYRIHGSNEPETIGQAVSSGCFRMTNEDVADLYDRVRLGAKVIVQQ
jgi:lipoprotein-anchoring transpeptidase ErfK/SrfK